MHNPLIKVCGLREAANVQAVSMLPVDYLGFILYPPSPRFVTEVPQRSLTGTRKRVGVTVNLPLLEVVDAVRVYDLDVVQLHGQESPEYCAELGAKVPVWKALAVDDDFDFAATRAYAPFVQLFLFDAKGAYPGGNGSAFRWELLEHYTGPRPFLLSGGIQPDWGEKIKTFQHPYFKGVDLNSRFEDAPAVKNISLLENFIYVLHH